ncbi:MAG: HemK2/MTQ2 family protein methyltransferase [Candidatus Asgardarchaeia archaeon]
MIIEIDGFKIRICENVYRPSDDTYLIMDNIPKIEFSYVLDMGTGTGILAIYLSKMAKRVLATDINPYALRCAQENLKLNGIENVEVRMSDLFSNIKPDEKFDLIIFNPPYLPRGEDDHIVKPEVSKSWVGGDKGCEVIDRFLKDAWKHLMDRGVIEFLFSSLTEGIWDVLKRHEKMYEFRFLKKRRFLFEEIYLYKASLKGRSSKV